MDISTGAVIWSAVKPVIKIYLIAMTGFFLAKRNMLTVETTRSLSDIILTVLLPCLTFNKVVANVEGSDIKSIGVICLSAVVIFGAGGLCAFIVRSISPVPKKWAGGVLAGGIFPNISDIPIAYIQTMDSGFILTPEQGEKGIAHVIIFLAMFMLCLFNLGGFRLMEYDFRDTGDVESQNVELKKQEMPGISDNLSKLPTDHGEDEEDDEDDSESMVNTAPVAITEDTVRQRRRSSIVPAVSRSTLERFNTAQSTFSTVSSVRSISRAVDLRRLPSQGMNDVIDQYSEAGMPTPIETTRSRLARILTSDVGVTGEDIINSTPTFMQRFHLSIVSFFIQNCLRPCSLALIISLTVAFIPWVKALFVTTTVYMPNAPDQMPPLSFIMDYTSYIGAASVPMALLLLGGCIARLKLGDLAPGFWISACSLVVLRLCVMPILGVLWVNRLTSAGWIDKDDAVLKFVICMTWGLPSMTTQIYFTAFLTRPDATDMTQMECTSFYLMIQYPLLVVSMPVLVTYVVKNMM